MPLVGEGFTADDLVYYLYEVPGKNPPWNYLLVLRNEDKGVVEYWEVAVGVPGSVRDAEELIYLLESRGSGIVTGEVPEEWVAYAKVRRGVIARLIDTSKIPKGSRGLGRALILARGERERRVRAPRVRVKMGLGRDEVEALKALFDDIWINIME